MYTIFEHDYFSERGPNAAHRGTTLADNQGITCATYSYIDLEGQEGGLWSLFDDRPPISGSSVEVSVFCAVKIIAKKRSCFDQVYHLIQ